MWLRKYDRLGYSGCRSLFRSDVNVDKAINTTMCDNCDTVSSVPGTVQKGCMGSLLKLANIPVKESYTSVVVTDDHVTVVDLEPSGEGFVLSGFGKVVLDKPIRKQPGLAAAGIKAICRKNMLQAKTACVLAPTEDLLIRRHRMPVMERQEIIDSARFSERENSPFPIETASIDAWVEHGGKTTGSSNVLIAALGSSQTGRLKKLFRHTPLKLTAISIVPAALAAVVKVSRKIEASLPLPIINIDESTTGIYFFVDGQVNFIREINIGGKQMRENYEPCMERLVNEINRSFEHFKNRQRVNNIEPVLMCGSAASLKKIAAYLTSVTEYDFQLYNPFDDFLEVEKESLKYAREMGPELVVPLGLAIDRGRTINLLPERFRYSFDKFKGRLAPLAVTAAYLIFLTWLKFTGAGYLDNVQRSLNSAKRITSALQKEEKATIFLVNEIFKVKSEIRSVDERIRFYPEIKGNNVKWSALFLEISRHLPDNAALDKITLSFSNTREYAAKGKTNGKRILINGKVRGNAENKLKSLRTYLEKMQSSALFEHASLISTKQGDSLSTLLFTLTADMRYQN